MFEKTTQLANSLAFPEVVTRVHFSPPERHIRQLQQALLDWFEENKRPLPWRENYTPYEIWISEIMLQQTQMERGVEYFKRWMKQFPDIQNLARASEDEVLKLWEGLGYYSRARHILSTAKIIVEKFDGFFPSDPKLMRSLPGIGTYTAGAISSIAFGMTLPCIDANVERVVSRVFNIDSPVKQKSAVSAIRTLALKLVPEGKARVHNQAMMELGALICAKKPHCGCCPIIKYCTGNYLQVVDKLPVSKKRSPVRPINMATGVLWHHGKIFLQKRLSEGVWSNLWEFPGGRIEKNENPASAVVREFLEETGFVVLINCKYGVIKHSYTIYRVTLHCFELELTEAKLSDKSWPLPLHLTAASTWRWAGREEIINLPMSAPHRRLANSLLPRLC